MSTFRVFGLTGMSTFRVFGLTGMSTFRVFGLTGMSTFRVFGLTRMSTFRVFGLTGMSTFRVFGLTGMSTFRVFGLTRMSTFRVVYLWNQCNLWEFFYICGFRFSVVDNSQFPFFNISGIISYYKKVNPATTLFTCSIFSIPLKTAKGIFFQFNY